MISKSQLLALFVLLIIILYGALARWSVLNNTIIDRPIYGRVDAADYFIYARNLSLFSTFSRSRPPIEQDSLKKDATRPPAFPFFASLFYQENSVNSLVHVLTAQTLIQCFVFLLLSILCWQFWGAWTSVIMSLLIWTHPAFMSINTYYLTESLFLSSVIIVALSFALSLRTKFGLFFVILFGCSLAFTALVRPTMEYYVFFIMLLLFFQSPQFSRKILPAIVVFFVGIVSWKIRNYIAIGSFSDPQLMINGLFHGSYPNFMYNGQPESYGFPYHFDPHAKEYYKGVGTTLQLIWARAVEQPDQYLSWYLLGKQLFLWQWDIVSGQGDVFIYPIKTSPFLYQKDLIFWHSIHKTLNDSVMIIGVVYSYYLVLINLIKKQTINATNIMASIVVYASLFHIIVAPFPRYGIPFKVFVFIMFILAIKSFMYSIQKRVLT